MIGNSAPYYFTGLFESLAGESEHIAFFPLDIGFAQNRQAGQIPSGYQNLFKPLQPIIHQTSANRFAVDQHTDPDSDQTGAGSQNG